MAVGCRQIEETFLHAYVDGEFSPEERAEVQQHLAGCPGCTHAVRLHQEFHEAIVRGNVPAPHALYDAVRARIAGESIELEGRWQRSFRDPRAIAAAAAAVGAAAWFIAGGLRHPILTHEHGHSLVDDSITLHAKALPLDYAASDAVSVRRWLEGKVDFGANIPSFRQGPRLEGVRLSSFHARTAAMITYTVPEAEGRRVTLLIVDDPEPLLGGTARRIADREVYLARARGFNVASWRKNEVVYALVSDLDEQDVVALVRAAELH